MMMVQALRRSSSTTELVSVADELAVDHETFLNKQDVYFHQENTRQLHLKLYLFLSLRAATMIGFKPIQYCRRHFGLHPLVTPFGNLKQEVPH